MAIPSSGNPGFNGAEFRNAIRFVYDMAAAPVDEERLTFYFASQLVYNTGVDGENVPFDPTATVTRIVPPPVRNVPCGITYRDRQGEEIVFGTVTATRLAVTLLDEDYERVKGCDYVVIGGDKYIYKRTEPPSGLFDVGLYTMHFTAESET